MKKAARETDIQTVKREIANALIDIAKLLEEQGCGSEAQISYKKAEKLGDGRETGSGIDHSGLLNVHYLEGLARLIQDTHPGCLGADDLAKILDPLSNRLKDTNQQSTPHMHQLTLAVSHVLNAMADTMVPGLDLGVAQEPDISSLLVSKNCVNDHSLLKHLEERVQHDPLFKGRLLAYIEHSKKDRKWRTAAANAITILVRAGVQFIGTDLQGIRIPGADLSYGVFDSANLQDADLRDVNLRGAWLRQTDMSRSQMAGVQFGELPFLTEVDKFSSCAYSPDGQSFAVGLRHGNINMYTTSNWEKTRTLKGHTDLVWRVVYSPNGDQIASCSQDNSVRLWDSKTGSLQLLLIGHDDWVSCVAYSPQGNLIASASDVTVRIWDTVTGECCQTLNGRFGRVCCVAYSPNGIQIASSDADHTISLWDLETGNRIHTLIGHNGQ
ncbi:hypothetical protein BGX34_010488, partial [Mortierella sp. NVP85]